MATYKIKGTRFLRKYTEPQESPTYAAAIEAQNIVREFCNIPWEKVSADAARMSYHTSEIVAKDGEESISGLDMNVRIRDSFDAALFCAGHRGGQHRAYANAAVYRYALPASAEGISLTSLALNVTSDPYNSQGVRIHVFTNSTGEIPMNCHTVRGEDGTGAVIDDGTTAAAVVKRTVRTESGGDYWYPTNETVTISPTGGLTLQKYLFILVALESYSTVRGNWLEGSSFIENTVSMTLSTACADLDADELNDLSESSDALIEFPVVRNGVTQFAYGEVYGFCDVAVMANGDRIEDLANVDGSLRYFNLQDLADGQHRNVSSVSPKSLNIGLRALYARFFKGQIELADPIHDPTFNIDAFKRRGLSYGGAMFSVRKASWSVRVSETQSTYADIDGWVISSGVVAIPFSVPSAMTVNRLKLSWGAYNGGAVDGGKYNFWLKRGVAVESLPETLVKNPEIYVGEQAVVDGWELLGSSKAEFGQIEIALQNPIDVRLATVLVTAFADQRSLPDEWEDVRPYGVNPLIQITPSAVSEDSGATRGKVQYFGLNSINSETPMKPDITLLGCNNGSDGEFDGGDNMGVSRVPLSRNPLCFTAEEADSTVSMSPGSSARTLMLQVSTDGCETWSPFVPGRTVITLDNVGDKVYFAARHDGVKTLAFSSRDIHINKFVMTGRIAASGDVTSLLSPSRVVDDLTGRIYAFTGLFSGCTSLTAAPELPATTLEGNCYAGMFNGCTALTTAPELPATTLAVGCYYRMFAGCTALTEAPELPVTTLANNCYAGMFKGCTALTEAPELPATTLAAGCYGTNIGEDGTGMFQNCTSLTAAPELPATTLADHCYSYMFSGCTSLTAAPELPVTTLAYGCYVGMFKGCTALTAAPELPATTLEGNCYLGMFNGCTALTTAPELPATGLTHACYYEMFKGCSSLSQVSVSFVSWSDDYYDTWWWLDNVSASGTFKCPSALANSSFARGVHTVPSGWTIVTS